MSDVAAAGDVGWDADRRAIEAGRAVLLGLAPEDVDQLLAAVAALPAAVEGVAVVGVLAAARWGTAVDEALTALAGGKALRGAPSDYELRQAAEEAESDVDAAEAALRTAAHDAGRTDGSAVRHLGAASPVVDAVLAAREGVLRWAPAVDTAPPVLAELRRVAGRIGAEVEH